MNRRSERSHELTSEDRRRGGLIRAAKINTAKAEAMAEGRPYKATRRRRRRGKSSTDPHAGRGPWRGPDWNKGKTPAERPAVRPEDPPQKHSDECRCAECQMARAVPRKLTLEDAELYERQMLEPRPNYLIR